MEQNKEKLKNIIIVETKEQLEKLYKSCAITWEGLIIEDLELALKTVGQSEAKGYLIKGKVMNEICQLTGDNAYPDFLNIFSIIDFLEFEDIENNFNARFMDDIINDNAVREG
jgi:hypothetical protein